MRYSHILFDLDGTITDPFDGISASICYAFSKFGIEVKDKNDLRTFIGPPLFDSFRAYCKMTREESELAVKYYRERYLSGGIYECTVYDGIEDLLKNLSESPCKVILATSKPESMAHTVLEHFGLDRYFDFICGASLDESRAKKADVIAYALGVSGANDLKSCVMIGDTRFDIEGALQNSISPIAVSYGYGSREELENAGAGVIFDDPHSLFSYLAH